MFSMQRCGQSFGEQISAIVLGRDAEELHRSFGHPISNQVVPDVDVFSPGVVDVILRDESSTDVVDVGFNGQVDSGQLADEVNEIQPLLHCL